MMTMLELPLAMTPIAAPPVASSVSSSMGMEMMSFDMPSLSMDIDFSRITDALESEKNEAVVEEHDAEAEKIVSQDERDDLVQSQLELVKIWVVQGKVVAARALLEAIVQTGTHWQQQRALMMLDELSKDDGVDPS